MTRWEQESSTLFCAGDVRVIRLWDMQTEARKQVSANFLKTSDFLDLVKGRKTASKWLNGQSVFSKIIPTLEFFVSKTKTFVVKMTKVQFLKKLNFPH